MHISGNFLNSNRYEIKANIDHSEIRIHGLQGVFIYHIITLTLFFRILFAALVLFHLMKLKILICQIIDSQFA